MEKSNCIIRALVYYSVTIPHNYLIQKSKGLHFQIYWKKYFHIPNSSTYDKMSKGTLQTLRPCNQLISKSKELTILIFLEVVVKPRVFRFVTIAQLTSAADQLISNRRGKTIGISCGATRRCEVTHRVRYAWPQRHDNDTDNFYIICAFFKYSNISTNAVSEIRKIKSASK